MIYAILRRFMTRELDVGDRGCAFRSAETRRGMCLALQTRVRFGVTSWMACLTLTALLSGCPVTDQIELPSEPNYPPSIVSPPTAVDIGRSMNQIIRINLSDPEVGTELTLPFIIRDANVDQALEYRVFLDSVTATSTVLGWIFSSEVLESRPMGTVERSLEIRIPFVESGGFDGGLEQPGCHRVEILVSTAFDAIRSPELVGDLGTAVWWIETIDPDNGFDTVDMSSCP